MNGVAPEFTVFCDGSGYVADSPGGWTSIIKKADVLVSVLTGNVSNGTNNLTEILPFVHSVWWIQTKFADARYIEFYCDSEFTVKVFKKEYELKEGNPLRGLFNILWQLQEKDNFVFAFNHIPRNSNPYHEFCDIVGKEMRAINKNSVKTIVDNTLKKLHLTI